VQKFGFFVELMEIFVEGIVPITRIEELTGEQVFYRERDHAIVSGSGQRSASRNANRSQNPAAATGVHPDPIGASMSGNLATASACAPNASTRFGAASSFTNLVSGGR